MDKIPSRLSSWRPLLLITFQSPRIGHESGTKKKRKSRGQIQPRLFLFFYSRALGCRPPREKTLHGTPGHKREEQQGKKSVRSRRAFYTIRNGASGTHQKENLSPRFRYAHVLALSIYLYMLVYLCMCVYAVCARALVPQCVCECV